MIIQSTRVYYDEKIVPKAIMIEDGKIKDVLPYGLLKADKDYGDNLIMPGLIDIHNHGYDMGDNNHATKEWLDKWVRYLPSEGVTSTLSTISSAPYDVLIESLKNIGAYLNEDHEGTNILGVYSEGPFISTDYRGAQSLECKIIPDRKVINAFDEACGHRLVLVMLAPEELNGDYDVIRYMVEKGIRVTLGHTGATYDIAMEAIKNGGVHVKKEPAKILATMKGKDKLILVTDSVAIKGLKPGRYEGNGRVTIVGEDGVGRLENGTLAGSCNKLNKVLQFAIKSAKIDEVIALNACTINPCRMLGIGNKGLIFKGYDADITVFDEEFEPVDVYIGGVIFKD